MEAVNTRQWTHMIATHIWNNELQLLPDLKQWRRFPQSMLFLLQKHTSQYYSRTTLRIRQRGNFPPLENNGWRQNSTSPLSPFLRPPQPTQPTAGPIHPIICMPSTSESQGILEEMGGGWDFKDKRSQNQAPKVFWAKGIFGTRSWERLLSDQDCLQQFCTPKAYSILATASKAQNLIMDFMKTGPRVGLFKHNEAKRKWNTILAISYPFHKTKWNSHLYHLQAKRQSSKLTRKPGQEKREVGYWILCAWSQPLLPESLHCIY